MGPEHQHPRSSPDAVSDLCPDLRGLLERMEKGDPAALAHTRICPRCAGEWALYRGFMRAPDAAHQRPIIWLQRLWRALRTLF